jgi:hypothetical protein
MNHTTSNRNLNFSKIPIQRNTQIKTKSTWFKVENNLRRGAGPSLGANGDRMAANGTDGRRVTASRLCVEREEGGEEERKRKKKKKEMLMLVKSAHQSCQCI